MDQNQETTLFGFGIDTASRAHLSEAAKWAKFLAIVGFVVCGLIVIAGIFAGSFLSVMSGAYSDEYRGSTALTSGMGAVMAVMYIGMAILFFFPYLFLFRFANQMKSALNTNDQQTLNSSFQNLKVMFRYVGILTIVLLSFYALAILMVIVSAASGNYQ
ncbi:MAG TPA: DUF5362 family protein [Chitinophagaceae bacterium]|jgi:uncharacterized membrane protein YjgN (DUF898 family)|nr:DUF5362 family protein [Chitinophagaceae bacterium]